VRRLVARYGACLSQLTTRQRRVLRLRAGVGPREPVTRAVVARRLELPVAKVRRAERRGLRALRRSAREGCGAASDGAGAEPGVATAPAGGGPASASTVLASGSGGGDAADGTAAGGDPAGGGGKDAGGGSQDGAGGTGGGASGGVKGISATRPAEPGGATDVTLPLLAIVLAGLTAVAVRGIRRSRAT
jgi:Sigma-70, region 4